MLKFLLVWITLTNGVPETHQQEVCHHIDAIQLLNTVPDSNLYYHRLYVRDTNYISKNIYILNDIQIDR